VGVVDPSTGEWHLRGADTDVTSFLFGNPGDSPFMGDWDCDGFDTPGMYRQSNGFAYLRNSNTQRVADVSFYFGNPNDIPLAGDFNGDGCDTVSVYRPSEGRAKPAGCPSPASLASSPECAGVRARTGWAALPSSSPLVSGSGGRLQCADMLHQDFLAFSFTGPPARVGNTG